MKHKCKMDTPCMDSSGPAIERCYEDNAGKFWVTNDEYSSQVFYCPYCGAKAPIEPDYEKWVNEDRTGGGDE